MNYNDYDSNGNKKRIDFSDALNDKQKRARIILLGYFIFIVLIIMVVKLSSNTVVKNDNKEPIVDDNKEKVEVVKDEIDEKFSFIDQNNYNFTFTIDYQNQKFIIKGKRYDNKYSFTYSNLVDTIEFLGTDSNIRMKGEDGYTPVIFPYVYVNFFDNNELKNIIRNSTYIEGVYKITNEKINDIVSLKGNIDNKDELNSFELILMNNKVVAINIDCSNAISDLQNENLSVKIRLEYENYGLVEDFDVNFD